MINVRLRVPLLLIGTVLAFAIPTSGPAIAAPSDWADIVDHNPKKRIPYDRSRSVERAPVKSAKQTKVAKAEKAEKKSKKKAKKAPRRGKKKSRR